MKLLIISALILCFLKGISSQGCGGQLVVGELTILTSPNYPTSAAEKDNTYPSDSDCTWKNIGAPNTLNIVKFLDSRIEIGEDDSNITCDFDYVNVTVESIGGRKYCGYTKHEEKIVGLGSLWIHFVSDDSVNYRGFKLGYSIENNYDPCEGLDDYCGAEGRCYSDDGVMAKCRCVPGTTGEYCDADIRECQSNPCQNGGRCDDSKQKNHYECECGIAFLGYNCEQARPRPCDSDPCINGGTCQELPGWEHQCSCREFFQGDSCEVETGCGNPGLDGIDEFMRYHTGTKIEYNCSSGFEMIGKNISECQSTRQWSSPKPECKEIIIPDPYDGVFFTPFVTFMTSLIGTFLLFGTLLGFWLKYRGPCVPIAEKVVNEQLDTISGKLSTDKSQDMQKSSEISKERIPNCSDSSENMFKNDDIISDDVFVTKNEVDGNGNND